MIHVSSRTGLRRSGSGSLVHRIERAVQFAEPAQGPGRAAVENEDRHGIRSVAGRNAVDARLAAADGDLQHDIAVEGGLAVGTVEQGLALGTQGGVVAGPAGAAVIATGAGK